MEKGFTVDEKLHNEVLKELQALEGGNPNEFISYIEKSSKDASKMVAIMNIHSHMLHDIFIPLTIMEQIGTEEVPMDVVSSIISFVSKTMLVYFEEVMVRVAKGELEGITLRDKEDDSSDVGLTSLFH